MRICYDKARGYTGRDSEGQILVCGCSNELEEINVDKCTRDN